MRTNEAEKVVALIDNQGRLFCADCATQVGVPCGIHAGYEPVYSGSHPHSLESCDRCGKPVEK